MKLMSVDQSLSHCAVVIFDDGVPVYREMIRTGSNNSKSKKNKDVIYFDNVHEQIRFIVGRILTLAEEHRIDKYVMEALALVLSAAPLGIWLVCSTVLCTGCISQQFWGIKRSIL